MTLYCVLLSKYVWMQWRPQASKRITRLEAELAVLVKNVPYWIRMSEPERDSTVRRFRENIRRSFTVRAADRIGSVL